MSFERKLQRRAEKQARDRAAIKAEGPQPGDVIVGCAHKPDPRRGSHCFYVGTDTGEPSLDLLTGEKAKWIFLCQACNDAYGHRMEDALEKREVPLTLVAKWREEDGKLRIIPVTFTRDDPGTN